MKKTWKLDIERLPTKKHNLYLKVFFYLLRHAKESKFIFKHIYRLLFHIHSKSHGIEMNSSSNLGYGFCIWHPYNITIGGNVIIGNNVTVCKGVLIGHEFRGKRHGSPTISNNVWIGANSVIVGKIIIGNDVLIAPNTYVNIDVPDHSIVIGSPCKIIHKDNATAHYIQNPISYKCP